MTAVKKALAEQLREALRRVSEASRKTEHEDGPLHGALGDLYGCAGRAILALRDSPTVQDDMESRKEAIAALREAETAIFVCTGSAFLSMSGGKPADRKAVRQLLLEAARKVLWVRDEMEHDAPLSQPAQPTASEALDVRLAKAITDVERATLANINGAMPIFKEALAALRADGGTAKVPEGEKP